MMDVMALKILDSDFEGSVMVLWKGYKLHVSFEHLRSIWVWIHEFTEETVRNLLHKMVAYESPSTICCFVVGQTNYASLPHLLVSLHTLSIVMVGEEYRVITSEQFANLTFIEEKMQ